MKGKGYQPRTYRSLCRAHGLVDFNVTVAESDLMIRADHDLFEKGLSTLRALRFNIEEHARTDNAFLTSLRPVSVPVTASEIVKDMAAAGSMFGVGPMAAVAGAIAEEVARELYKISSNVIVENGGDVYVIGDRPVTTAIYAGDSPLSMKIGIELEPPVNGISICTSSGTVGHSLSFGKADAVTVVSSRGSVADAAATAICNMVKSDKDLQSAVDHARKFNEITGLLVIAGGRIIVYGEKIELVQMKIDE